MTDFETVKRLIAEGRNDCEVSRMSGVPRSTIRDWRRGCYGATIRGTNGMTEPCRCLYGRKLPPGPYSYLFGLYLGDGCISRSGRASRLRVVLDSCYPGIIDACAQAMEALMPGKRAYHLARPGCIEVSMYSKHWPCLFPQHGPGRKHERLIQLTAWQENLIQPETKSFLRGLIHSDGCRVVANDRGRPSIRYHFSNRSDDIKGIFCEALDRLDIRWTRPSDRDIAIYRKESVARLDEFIGPKR